jgi:hypothetical protein
VGLHSVGGVTCGQEFELWLKDVKKIADFNGSKREQADLFAQYCEDYNTMTLPGEKYYDLKYYEHQKMLKAMQKKAKKGPSAVTDEEQRRCVDAPCPLCLFRQLRGAAVAHWCVGVTRSWRVSVLFVRVAVATRREIQEQREKERKAMTELIHSTMTEEKLSNIRYQQELQAKMQLAFKTGDRKEAERIKRLLAPDEPK